MNGDFFNYSEIDLVLTRNFDDIRGAMAVVGGKVKGVIINDDDGVESITVNGIEMKCVTNILKLDNFGLLEVSHKISALYDGLIIRSVQSFPLNRIWQFGVKRLIIPTPNDHHGNEDDSDGHQ